MNFYTKLIKVIIVFFFVNNLFSQNRNFYPELWLLNPNEFKPTKENVSSLNNFNKIYPDELSLNSSIKKINQPSHLFVVYESDIDENIVSIFGNEESIFVNTKNIKINDEVNLDGYNIPYGELVDIKFSNIFDGKLWLNSKIVNSNIYELILLNNSFSQFSINEIRTYLSLKYGIDLIDKNQYEYNNKKLWTNNLKDFNHKIFGIAKFTSFNLIPKNTYHSKDKDLFINIDQKNKSLFNDGDYLLIGNNNKSLSFTGNVSDKIWIVETNLENISVDLAIPLSKLNSDFIQYKLQVQQNNLIKNYSGIIKDTLLLYKNISFNKKEISKLSLKKIQSDFRYEIESTCELFDLKILNDQLLNDFHLTVKNDQGRIIISEKDKNFHIKFKAPTSSFYDVIIRYNQEIYFKRFKTFQNILNLSGLKKTYDLLNGECHIKLKSNNEIEWFKGATKIGNGNELKFNSTGEYTVKIYDTTGCYVSQNFEILSEKKFTNFSIYPNPLDSNTDLQIKFELNNEQFAEVYIYTLSGTLLKNMIIGTVKTNNINLGKLNEAAGVYMVVVYLDKIPQIQKIIIK